MKVELNQLDLPWQGILPGLLAKKFDLVATSVSVTEERVKKYAYTVPIAEGTSELARDGMTMIVVTHELGFANRISDRIVFMEAGRIVEAGPPRQILRNPHTDRLKLFLSKLVHVHAPKAPGDAEEARKPGRTIAQGS